MCVERMTVRVIAYAVDNIASFNIEISNEILIKVILVRN